MRLADCTTLGLGGPAREFLRAGTEQCLIEAVRSADEDGSPLLVLGGGSNVVVADEGFDGTVVQVATTGVGRGREPGEVTVAAGEDWDEVVAWTVAEGLAGLECLSGIPGRAGATPIQNVGAYGQEVSQVITEVRAYDRVTGKICRFGRAECGFGYRTSMFKRDGARRYVVLSVTFGLAAQPSSAPVRYAELAAALGVQAGDQVPNAQARSAVLALRRGKGMVLDPSDPDSRSAGSFFVNPVLDPAALAVVEAAARDRCGPEVRVPRFDAGDGLVKVPAAWLIERAGFSRGYRLGGTDGGGTDGGGTDGGGGAPGGGALGARVSAKHTLALVNPGAATTAGLLDLARHIRDGVRDTFGVSLTPEPVLVGVTL